MRNLAALAAFAVVAALAIMGAPWPPVAKAAGVGNVDSYTVSCGTTATEISAPSGGQFSYQCINPSTTAVAVGDNDLAAPAAADSPTFCKTNCELSYFGGEYRKEFCRVDSGTVTIYCRAKVHAAP